MSYGLQLRDKAGVYTDIPFPDDVSAQLSMRLEGSDRLAVADDVSIDLDNTDLAWNSIFTRSNLSTLDIAPAAYGFRVLRDGVPVWEGDLAYDSVELDSETDRVPVQVLDPLARLDKGDASLIKRDYSAIAIVTGGKQTKQLTVNSALDANGEPLVAGDIIRLGHYKPQSSGGNKLVQQELTVASVAGSVITFKQKLKCNYLATDAITVLDSWFRGKTVAWLLAKLLDAEGQFDSGHRIILYDAVTYSDIVDVANFDMLTTGQACEKLGKWVNAQVWTKLGVLYFAERAETADGSLPKNIDDLVVSGPVKPVAADRYDKVVIKGMDGRWARRGWMPHGGKKLEIDLPFTRDRAKLQEIADRTYNWVAQHRQGVDTCTVADDGSTYQLRQPVSLGGVVYLVTSVSTGLDDGGVVELALLEENGTLPDPGTAGTDAWLEDDEEPPEPVDFVFTKAYSAMFDTVFPEAIYPRLQPRREKVGTYPNGATLYLDRLWRFWECRWRYPYDEIKDLIWRFEVTVWPDGKDRDKPRLTKGFKPDLQSDGYYYGGFYLPAGKLWWADVLARTEALKEGTPSDENSSSTEDDIPSDDALPVITGVALASAVDDIPGTPGKECDLDVVVTWTGMASVMHVEVTKPDGKIINKPFNVSGKASPYTCHFHRRFKRGITLGVKVQAQNGPRVLTALYDAGSVTAGGSAIPAPTAPTISSVTHTKVATIINVTIPNDAGAGVLQLFAAVTGTASNPDSAPSAWNKIDHKEVMDDVAAGRGTVTCTINRPGIARKALIGRIRSRYDHTVFSAWSSVYDAGTVPDSDDTPPASCSISLESPLDDIPGTTRKEASLGVTFNFSGADRVKAVFQDTTSLRKFTVEGTCATTDTSLVLWIERKLKAGNTINTIKARAFRGTAYTDAGYLPNIVAGSGTVSGGKPAVPSAPTVALVSGSVGPHHAEFDISWTSNAYLKTLRVQKYQDSAYKECEPVDLLGLVKAGITTTRVKVHFKYALTGGTIPNVLFYLVDSYDQVSSYGYYGSAQLLPSPLAEYQVDGRLDVLNSEIKDGTLAEAMGNLIKKTASKYYIDSWRVWDRPVIGRSSSVQFALPSGTEVRSGLMVPVFNASGTAPNWFQIFVYYQANILNSTPNANKWGIFKAATANDTDAQTVPTPADPTSSSDPTLPPAGGCFGPETLVLMADWSAMTMAQLRAEYEAMMGKRIAEPDAALAVMGYDCSAHDWCVTAAWEVLLHPAEPMIRLNGVATTAAHLWAVSDEHEWPRQRWIGADGITLPNLLVALRDKVVFWKEPVNDGDAGVIDAYNLTTGTGNYWVSNDGVTWYLVHNAKALP